MQFSLECHYYQLRAYFYQARELYAGDKTGFSGEPLLHTQTHSFINPLQTHSMYTF